MPRPATFDLAPFAQSGLTLPVLESLVDEHERLALPRHELLWSYYRNPMRLAPPAAASLLARSGSPLSRWRSPRSAAPHGRYRLAQERGLPTRLLGRSAPSNASRPHTGWMPPDDRFSSPARKEIVIENDIAWRIHTMIEFLIGSGVTIESEAADPERRARIESALRAVWDRSGGVSLLHELALLAHVHGHADLLVRAHPAAPEPHSSADEPAVTVEIVDPFRAIPLVNPHDYRSIDAYVIRWCRRGEPTPTSAPEAPSPSATPNPTTPARLAPSAPSILRRILDRWSSSAPTDALSRADDPRPDLHTPAVVVTEIIDAHTRRVFEQRVLDSGLLDQPVLTDESPSLVRSDRNRALGPPVVHLQNITQPLAYEGLSEVEPLIPLQDELNTRLSDRANRVTLQSFKMLLAKGFTDVPGFTIAPGTIWKTDNPDAHLESFGGDAASPSEERHIEELREALDKVSGVPPLAGGVVRARIGNLSSATALRVTLMGLLSKSARKRVLYGRAIAAASALILEALNALDILNTRPDERALRVKWPDTLPRDERESLDAALKKIELGVDRRTVLAELGYATSAPTA
ncbi:MAG: phage portal protein [Phycisphaeraceae bacterium]|nr:phage portal protein [Phycisphaeraceae bacterium]